MSPKRKVQPILPYSNGRRMSLFNPAATFSIGRVFTLMRDRQLYGVLCQTESAKKLRTDRPLIALKLLEENGYQNGLDPSELAAELECTVKGARNAMNQAEFLIWREFGLVISFFGRRAPWRILNHLEVALKYMHVTKANASKQKRAKLYQNTAQYHGSRRGELKAPLFQFDFKDTTTPAALN